MSKALIIVGSSRDNGDSIQLANSISIKKRFDCINLNDYHISYYDYSHENKTDDFLPLMQKITTNYETLIFITPVYWYAMSGRLKVFFDRLTDLITIEKELGRKLRGKKMMVITSSNGDHLGEVFWIPFVKSAEYLGMEFLGGVHTIEGKTNDNLIEMLVNC